MWLKESWNMYKVAVALFYCLYMYIYRRTNLIEASKFIYFCYYYYLHRNA